MKIDTYKEYEAIKNIIKKYIEAGLKGDSSIMKFAFHKDATMYGHIDGKLVGGPIETLFDIIDSGEPAKNLKAEITTIDYIGGIAQVKAECENWNGARYTDMFILVKDNDDWKILTKVYYTH